MTTLQPTAAGSDPLLTPVDRSADGSSPVAATRPVRQLPVTLFSVPFGLAGLAGTWLYAGQLHLVPSAVGAVLVVVSALVWSGLAARYAHLLTRRGRRVVDDLLDPTAGPFTSLALITPMALTVAGLAPTAPALARPLFDVLVALVVGLAGWLTGQWIYAPLDVDRLHPGYFLPSVAGGYLGSSGAAVLGQNTLAQALFGLATLSWLVLGALLLGRLMLRPALPPALQPTLAIEVAPAALATLAWLALHGGRLDAVASSLGGYALLMALAQLRLLTLYRRLPFSAGFWAFTFPSAAVTTVVLHWLAPAAPVGRTAGSYLLLAAVTALTTAVACRTVLALWRTAAEPHRPAR